MPWTDAEMRRMTKAELVEKHRREHAYFAGQERAERPKPGRVEEIRKAHGELAGEMVRRGLKHASPLEKTAPQTLGALKADLTVCQLCGPGRRMVPGEGSRSAKAVIVGESPGREEVERGRPFVGVAGRRLMGVLDSLGLAREDVYLTNAVKCYVGRRPTRAEVETCRPWLLRELRLVGKEKRVVALGMVAGRALAGVRARKAPHPVAREKRVAARVRRAVGR